MRTKYYRRDGTPASLAWWMNQMEGDADLLRRVARDDIGDALVSTVFLGLNHRWDDGPPLIFETMIFGGPHDESQWRYSTEAMAQAGHAAIVAALRAGEAPPETLPE